MRGVPGQSLLGPRVYGNSVPAEPALIAVEIVSPSNPENDWVGKLRDYPLMGIPLYLLVDATRRSVTLFGEPEAGRYRLREEADFGETVHIPHPFGFVLDTSVLLPY
ncbi:Uma2 family endonuclease [Kitasatospora sp. NPDC056181]|uniref:Uma2 family endonuclease n=1 Tax=Kitasatospora sp. NPDC056181 TaxID=3345737 RepID=UPI0035DE418D